MKRLKSGKKLVSTVLLAAAAVTTMSSVASAWGWPRVPNPPLEKMCSDPAFFDSIAMGQACRDYINRGGWMGGSGSRWPSNTYHERGYFSPYGHDRSEKR